MKRRWLALLFFCTVVLTSATPADAGVTNLPHAERRIWRLMPEMNGFAHIDYTYDSKSALKNAPGQDISTHVIDVGGTVPIPISEHFAMGVGARSFMHHFRLHNVTNYVPGNSITGYYIGLVLDGFITLNDNWVLDVNFQPAISSDLKSIDSHDFQYPGGIVAGWAFSDISALFFGVFVSKEFWTYMPYPILGFVVRPENFFEFETILPQYIRANFRVADFCRLFIEGDFEGFVWDVKSRGGVPDHFVKLMDTHAGAGADFEIVKGVHFEMWGGIIPYRKMEFADRAGNAFTSRQKLGWFVKGGLVFTAELLGY